MALQLYKKFSTLDRKPILPLQIKRAMEMDLKINSEKICSCRKARAWSQEHLAHVAGVGRRTIQRVEKTGTASYESAKAIASALDLRVSDLIQLEELQTHTLGLIDSRLRRISLVVSSAMVLLLFFLGRSVLADQVSLDIEAIVDEEHETKAKVTNEEGEEALIQLAGNYRISITPSIAENGDVRLHIVLMRLDGEEYVRVGQPIIQTPNGELAVIRSATDDGRSLSLEITPSIL